MKHHKVHFQPDGKVVSIHNGATILEAAGRGGIILNSVCGGAGTCGKCLVTINDSDDKVLACEYKVESDLTVTVPESARFYEHQILERGIDTQIKVSPSIFKKFIAQSPGSAQELVESLNSSIKGHLHCIDDEVSARISPIFADPGDRGVTAVIHKTISCDETNDDCCYKILCCEKGDTTDELYGVAVDIGTTTLVAKLIDMTSGKTAAVASAANPQAVFGDDVVSRISFAETEEGFEKLHAAVIDELNCLIDELCNEAKIEKDHIYELTAAGNTTMSHIFLKFPVKQLGQAPYEAFSVKAEDRIAGDFGINIRPCGNIHILENIAGFVGSDTMAVAVATDIDRTDKVTLVVDIGTNGEILLAAGGRVLAASCAAGPALEGARISQGSRAVDGAIESVVINTDDINIDVIGDSPARSICGSGLIDIMAVLIDLGLVDMTGRLLGDDEVGEKVWPNVKKRLVEIDDQPAFVIAHNDDNEFDPVIFTQKDIRETQLAKAAIRAGIILLQKELGITDDDVEQILLAGAFGNFIKKESACRIGLLPNLANKIHFVGNAASSGAQMVLLSDQCRQLAARLQGKIEYMEIAHSLDFQMVFAEALMFESN